MTTAADRNSTSVALALLGTGAALAFIYDPWGTYIELNERPNPL